MIKVKNKIQLTRVDNRLVHGQIAVIWRAYLRANLILVPDDNVMKNKMLMELMKMTTRASGANVIFCYVKDIKQIVDNVNNEKVFIVCRTPQIARQLVDSEINIVEISVGNMYNTNGKRLLASNVYVDNNDLKDIEYIKAKGVDIYIQDMPNTKKIKL
ncbi:PTS sugar transporter subunit IIB [Clostridium pasteurianum]|uniref:Phosphotransferase system, mannose/fructose/N-acetylgalactosamine-specific component IIB n=1 Tax=Clostridium pasteurianum BC1 TaxID=86416 RepID=R4KAD1_CLOPA|nr:PTS sugar transporter subunit IIB [Clostridium pasteurianum]AGK98661.1 phosphotransferase system, mannose/fructose/N-acetylgalactosamine-specific component IIB [Clostridium pasteurianum BC1]